MIYWNVRANQHSWTGIQNILQSFCGKIEVYLNALFIPFNDRSRPHPFRPSAASARASPLCIESSAGHFCRPRENGPQGAGGAMQWGTVWPKSEFVVGPSPLLPLPDPLLVSGGLGRVCVWDPWSPGPACPASSLSGSPSPPGRGDYPFDGCPLFRTHSRPLF